MIDRKHPTSTVGCFSFCPEKRLSAIIDWTFCQERITVGNPPYQGHNKYAKRMIR